jgi:hypothetical protein
MTVLDLETRRYRVGGSEAAAACGEILSGLEAVTNIDWSAIEDAYAFVLAGKARRLDGAGWSVYAVGANVIRVDIRVEAA